MGKKASGLSILELLVSIVIFGVVTAAGLKVFRTQTSGHTQQQLSTSMEQNLRFAMAMVKDDLRRVDYGVPTTLALTDWVPNSWFNGFDANPKIVLGTGAAPDKISIAACTARPVATLSADAPAGTTLDLTYQAPYDSTSLDTGNRRLIRIGDSEFAWVTATGNPITIDTSPPVVNDQPLSRPYFAGTPVCRVDIVTFDIETSGGVTRMRRHLNQGGVFETAAEEITDLQITDPGGGRLRIVLTAQTEKNYPDRATRPTQSLGSDVSLINEP